MLDSTDSNSGKWPHDFFCFFPTFDFCEVTFSREHKLLFIPIGLCFMKRHVWKVSYFFIKRLTNIETSSIFLNSYQKILENSKNSRKFQKLNFHFMKPYSPKSTIIITTYPCIPIYTTSSASLHRFRRWLWPLTIVGVH